MAIRELNNSMYRIKFELLMQVSTFRKGGWSNE